MAAKKKTPKKKKDLKKGKGSIGVERSQTVLQSKFALPSGSTTPEEYSARLKKGKNARFNERFALESSDYSIGKLAKNVKGAINENLVKPLVSRVGAVGALAAGAAGVAAIEAASIALPATYIGGALAINAPSIAVAAGQFAANRYNRHTCQSNKKIALEFAGLAEDELEHDPC